jgi:N-methylhydantoinase A
VLAPADGGVLSALGMLLADVVRDYSRTYLRPAAAASPEALESAFAPLLERATRELSDEGFPPDAIALSRGLDLRYRGQSFEVPVSYDGGGGFEETFAEEYQRRYGYALSGRAVEVVTLRVRAVGATPKPRRPSGSPAGEDASPARRGERPVVAASGEQVAAALYDRERLAPGMRFVGPAVVTEPIATTWVPPGWGAEVLETGALLLKMNLTPHLQTSSAAAPLSRNGEGSF